MKILERIVDGLIRQLVSIDDSQLGFVPGRGTTDAIFVVRQLQEKYLAANKRLYMAFLDLEKMFDQVPRMVIWWALRKLGVEELTVCRTGVGSISISCNGCKHWVHKKCSGLKRLKKDPDYTCTRCQGTARPLDGRPQK